MPQPPQRSNPQYLLIDVITKLTEQLQRTNDFNDEQDRKVKLEPASYREAQEKLMGGVLLDPWKVPPSVQAAAQQQAKLPPQEPQAFPRYPEGTRYPGASEPPPSPEWEQPQFESKLTPNQEFRMRRDAGQGIRKSLGAYRKQSNLPPDAGRGTAAAGGGGAFGGVGSGGEDDPLIPGNNVLPWMLMGDVHGAPGAIRNIAMREWELQQSVAWGSRGADKLQSIIANEADPNTPSTRMGRVLSNVLGQADPETGQVRDTSPLGIAQGALGWAQNNRMKALAGTMALGGTFKTIGKISEGLSNARDIGQLLGYQSYGGGPGFLGFNNPLAKLPTNPAVQEGLAFEYEKQALMGRIPGQGFGAALTKQQATQAMDVIGNAGFSMEPQKNLNAPQGDAATIANTFMAPLMKQYPGLSAQDLGQFLDRLRYGAESTSQLTTALGDLGSQAKATQQTIGQAAGSLKAYSEATAAQGGLSAAGLATGAEFQRETGMSAQIGAKMIQSPIVQSMGLASGIMPWQIGESGPGAGMATGNAIDMLMAATAGMAQNRRVFDKQTGKWITVSGKQSQLDFVAQKLNIPRETLQAYMDRRQGDVARRRVTEDLGSEGTAGDTIYNVVKSATGFDPHRQLNAEQYARAQQMWNQSGIMTDLKKAGVSDKEIQRLSHEGFQQRIKDVQRDLGDQAGKANKIGDTTKVNVTIGLSGYAAKLFRVQSKNITPAKKYTNAAQLFNGNNQINQIVNNPTGDISSGGMGKGGIMSMMGGDAAQYASDNG